MDVATGEVLTDYEPRNRNQEWLAFLTLIDRTVPDDLDVHHVADKYAAHRHDNVTKWLEHPRVETGGTSTTPHRRRRG
jgi:hypothetical protein